MSKLDRLDLIRDIAREAIRIDWEEAFGGKSYGNTHLERVNKIVTYLLDREGGDKFVVTIAAWVHDVALATGDDYETERVKVEILNFLDKFDLTTEEKEKIAKVAAGHEEENNEISIEAKLVHDADAVDKCGSLGVVRHIWKMTNMLENRPLNGDADLEKLKNHLDKRQANLMTRTAIKLANKLNVSSKKFFINQDEAVKAMEKISELAWHGMNADKIVAELEREIKNEWVKGLSEQIRCGYLT